MSKYKIIIRNSPGWRSFDACTLGVSVTSPNWQHDHFASILDFAAEHFKSIRIDVTDLLYRHNFMAEGLPPALATARAGELGADWLERHRMLIEACPMKPDVIRWGQWYENPDYASLLDSFQTAYADSQIFQDAVEADVDGFFRRQGREPTPAERQHSRDYLIEEVAVLSLQARDRRSIKLYPGDELACLNVVRRGLVEGAPRGLEHEQFAKVRFHTRGNSAAVELCARQAPRPTSPSQAPRSPASLFVLNS
jgi:tRNA-dependent cyclodipeptide synthase